MRSKKQVLMSGSALFPVFISARTADRAVTNHGHNGWSGYQFSGLRTTPNRGSYPA